MQDALDLLIYIQTDITETRYVISAALALQIYEWFAGYVSEPTYKSSFSSLLDWKTNFVWYIILIPRVVNLIDSLNTQIHRKGWTMIKTLYLLCRYYPLVLWVLIIWAYVPNHTKATCDKVVFPVNAMLAPCVSLHLSK